MVANPEFSFMSEADYLAFERASADKHEYLNGQIRLMAGASWKHNSICANLMGLFYNQLRGTDCRARQSDLRVHIPPAKAYRYPDIVLICGTPQFTDEEFDTVLNPILLIEVLSSSSEREDRGEKFHDYRKIESLQEYLLVSQESARIESYLRQTGGLWQFKAVEGLEATFSCTALNCTLPLIEVYESAEPPSQENYGV